MIVRGGMYNQYRLLVSIDLGRSIVVPSVYLVISARLPLLLPYRYADLGFELRRRDDLLGSLVISLFRALCPTWLTPCCQESLRTRQCMSIKADARFCLVLYAGHSLQVECYKNP